MKTGTGAWYTERNTTRQPSSVEGMEWIVRCGKLVALVLIEKPEPKEKS